MTKANPTEHAEQCALIRMAKLHEARHPALKLLFAVPNAGQRNKVAGGRLKAEGMKAGVCDLLLLFPAHGFHGLAVEMKSMTGYASREQKDFLQALRANGYRAEVCRGWEQAWKVIAEYVGIKI